MSVQRHGFRWAGYGFDLLIAVAASVGLLEVLQHDSVLSGPRISEWLAASGVALVVLPLLARRRFPFAAPTAVWLLGVVFSFVDGRAIASTFSVYAAGIAAAFLLGNLPDAARARYRPCRLWSVGRPSSSTTTRVMSAGTSSSSPPHSPLRGAPALRSAQGRLRPRPPSNEPTSQNCNVSQRPDSPSLRSGRESLESSMTSWRTRSASWSCRWVRCGTSCPTPWTEDKSALRTVEETGRAALNEMRRLLGAMHDEGQDVELAPQPGLDRLDALVEKVRLAGLPVRLHVEGEPFPLPRAIDLSAYRIVQEGLTNSLKHADAEQAVVTVRYGDDGVQVEIRDDGSGTAKSDGLGRGLTGVRERVKIYGGEMNAGAAPGGGFVLRAHLPVGGYQP